MPLACKASALPYELHPLLLRISLTIIISLSIMLFSRYIIRRMVKLSLSQGLKVKRNKGKVVNVDPK